MFQDGISYKARLCPQNRMRRVNPVKKFLAGVRGYHEFIDSKYFRAHVESKLLDCVFLKMNPPRVWMEEPLSVNDG